MTGSTKWLEAARKADAEAKVEFVAKRLWIAYNYRVSGPRFVDAPGERWEELDHQTVRLYRGHAAAAIVVLAEWDSK
jgi:hypothetical protein